MKTFLLILTMLTAMSFQATNSFPSSAPEIPANQTLIAGVCGFITEGNIQKKVLQDCKGLYTFDGTTHKQAKNPVISYEAVLIPKPGVTQVIVNSGGAFAVEVTQFINQSKAGDQIIFRKIKAKVKGGDVQSLNSIPLTIE